MMKQASELNDIPHIIVATPGRLADLLKNDQFNLNEYLDNLQFLILDEADRMLSDSTLEPDLTNIFTSLTKVQN
jgi:ATP-dependent RNA helicase DDX49/DBP8